MSDCNERQKCRFNMNILCEYKKCSSCGWNPKVEEKRKRKTEKDRRVVIEVWRYAQ